MTHNITELFASDWATQANERMSVHEFLELCKTDRAAYATAAERMIKAIGEPELIDRKSTRLNSSH